MKEGGAGGGIVSGRFMEVAHAIPGGLISNYNRRQSFLCPDLFKRNTSVISNDASKWVPNVI